jgi:hypothetical protein
MKRVAPLLALMSLLGTAAVRAGVAELSWSPNVEADLAGYRLYYGTSSFQAGTGVWRSVAEVQATPGTVETRTIPAGVQRVTVFNLSVGRNYFFRLTAFNGRGEESDFNVDDEGRDTEVMASGRDIPPDRRVFSPTIVDGVNDVMLFPGGTVEVQVCDVNGSTVFHRSDESGADIAWDGRDDGGRWVPSGLYIARLKTANGDSRLQKIVVVK